MITIYPITDLAETALGLTTRYWRPSIKVSYQGEQWFVDEDAIISFEETLEACSSLGIGAVSLPQMTVVLKGKVTDLFGENYANSRYQIGPMLLIDERQMLYDYQQLNSNKPFAINSYDREIPDMYNWYEFRRIYTLTASDVSYDWRSDTSTCIFRRGWFKESFLDASFNKPMPTSDYHMWDMLDKITNSYNSNIRFEDYSNPESYFGLNYQIGLIGQDDVELHKLGYTLRQVLSTVAAWSAGNFIVETSREDSQNNNPVLKLVRPVVDSDDIIDIPDDLILSTTWSETLPIKRLKCYSKQKPIYLPSDNHEENGYCLFPEHEFFDQHPSVSGNYINLRFDSVVTDSYLTMNNLSNPMSNVFKQLSDDYTIETQAYEINLLGCPQLEINDIIRVDNHVIKVLNMSHRYENGAFTTTIYLNEALDNSGISPQFQ